MVPSLCANPSRRNVCYTKTYLHHQDDGIEGDHRHDEVLERRRDDELPDAILDRVLVLRHVAADRLGVDREVDTLFLYTRHTHAQSHLPLRTATPKKRQQLVKYSSTRCYL